MIFVRRVTRPGYCFGIIFYLNLADEFTNDDFVYFHIILKRVDSFDISS